MPRLISHRGAWWPRRDLQNHPASVMAALSAGYGIEVDVWGVRDQRLVLRHDESSAAHELTLATPASGQLFLHLKAAQNGMMEHLVNTLRLRGWLEHAYLFCSPSNDGLLVEAKDLVRRSGIGERLRTLATVDSLDGLNALLDQPDSLGGADGAWLEQSDGDWVDSDAIYFLHEAGKSAWVVSSELHGRPLNLGLAVGCWQEADGICTDYPHLLARVLDRDDSVVHPKEPWWE